MKRMTTSAVWVIVAAVLFLGLPTAMAGKPQDVIERSNGFPSGPHFNLNIHGKKLDYNCSPTPGGGSVFVCEYGQSTIQYVTNKKSSLTELVVLDPCATCFYEAPDNDPVKVMLPYEAKGYYAFGRILGKPNNGNNNVESSIILYPNEVVQACNDDPDNPDPNFGDYTSCDEVALGMIIGSNVYVAEPEVYRRFEPGATKGKGKSKATDITPLFTFSGWAVDERLDVSGPSGTPDGVIDDYDVPVDAWNIIDLAGIDPNVYDDDTTWGNNNDAIDLIGEWLLFQADQEPPMAWYFDKEWILNIADLVVTEQGLENDGTKLLQIRFYPVATTDFLP